MEESLDEGCGKGFVTIDMDVAGRRTCSPPVEFLLNEEAEEGRGIYEGIDDAFKSCCNCNC